MISEREAGDPTPVCKHGIRVDTRCGECKPNEGWHWLQNSNRSHFFLDEGTSICGKWMTLSSSRAKAPEVRQPCAECQRRLERRAKPP